jgi:hypothetical protein
MAKYLVIITPFSAEQPYILAIFPSGDDRGSIVRHKQYDIENLRQDMKDCLNASEDGFVRVLKIISETGRWSTEVSLSDQYASRLGWFE